MNKPIQDQRSSNRLHREMEAALMELMLPFADKEFGESSIDEALLVFFDDDEAGEFDTEDPMNPLFIPWFLFNWRIESEEEKPIPTAPMMKTIAEAYLESKRAELSADMIALIEASIRRPLSFYEVLEVTPGKGLKLEDLLLGQVMEVDEDTASTSLRQGEIILGSMLKPIKGHVRPLALAPFALDKSEKSTVGEVRAEILANLGATDLTEEDLIQQEAFVLGLYLDIIDEMLDDDDLLPAPPPPRPKGRR